MRRFQHYSISHKLTALNMLVSGAALLLACAVFFSYDFYTFRKGLTMNLSTQSQIIGANTVTALLFNDPHAAENTLSALTASPRVLYAQIYTADRQFFAEYKRDRQARAQPLPSISAGQTQICSFKGGQIALARSIIFQGKSIGFVYIRADLQAINDRLTSYTVIVVAVLSVSLVTALLISRMCQRVISRPVVQLAETAVRVSQERDYSIRMIETGNQDEISTFIQAFNEMLGEIQRRDTALWQAHAEMEQRVQERTRQLAVANKELEAFAYSVAHDLRAPLRSIDGFSLALLEDCAGKLDSDGKDYLGRVRAATQRMAVLIDDLLSLSRVARSEMQKETLNLSAVARSVTAELQKEESDRQVEFIIEENLFVNGDLRLLRIAIENLLSNAWKYTARHSRARIEFGRSEQGGRTVYFVRDDGAGFDPQYAGRLFGAFQRLHSSSEFPGTGVGLATVQRIIHRHGGEIWAEAAIDKGATFFFTL
jgi:signal transduction histidine kinase